MFAGQAEQLRLDILEQLDAPANEYKSVGHFAHALAPDVFEYVPASHLMHVLAPDVFEYVPAMQLVHAVADVLAAN